MPPGITPPHNNKCTKRAEMLNMGARGIPNYGFFNLQQPDLSEMELSIFIELYYAISEQIENRSGDCRRKKSTHKE